MWAALISSIALPTALPTVGRFPSGEQPDELESAIASDLSTMFDDVRNIDQLAVTMTGELADCFADRAIGVKHIVAHTQRAASRLGIDIVRFYGVDGQFRSAHDATQQDELVAAANWHALANFVARSTVESSILIDVGTTTTDIIPICDGRVATCAKTDFDRLQEGSLVYVGCRRTPVCALLSQVQFSPRDGESDERSLCDNRRRKAIARDGVGGRQRLRYARWKAANDRPRDQSVGAHDRARSSHLQRPGSEGIGGASDRCRR